MKTLIASRLISALGMVALGALVIAGALILTPEARSAAGAFSEGEKSYISSVATGARLTPGQSKASTTVAYINTTDTASSTVTGSLNGADTLVVNAQSLASSSLPTNGSRLLISIDVSNDNIDWYQFAQIATSTISGVGSTGNTFFYSGEIVHQWSVSTTTATGNIAKKQFVFEGLYGKFYRLRLSTVGSNQAIYVESYPIIPVPR